MKRQIAGFCAVASNQIAERLECLHVADCVLALPRLSVHLLCLSQTKTEVNRNVSQVDAGANWRQKYQSNKTNIS